MFTDLGKLTSWATLASCSVHNITKKNPSRDAELVHVASLGRMSVVSSRDVRARISGDPVHVILWYIQ